MNRGIVNRAKELHYVCTAKLAVTVLNVTDHPCVFTRNTTSIAYIAVLTQHYPAIIHYARIKRKTKALSKHTKKPIQKNYTTKKKKKRTKDPKASQHQ